VAEFDELFATALRGQDRLGPTHLRLRLDSADEVVATTRELVAPDLREIYQDLRHGMVFDQPHP